MQPSKDVQQWWLRKVCNTVGEEYDESVIFQARHRRWGCGREIDGKETVPTDKSDRVCAVVDRRCNQGRD